VVYDERIGEAEVAEPFATLADPKLPAELDGEVLTGSALLLAVVRVRGF
jgi:hypothetical protein